MSTPSPADVFDVLSRSRARLHRRATLGDGLAVAQWSNRLDATRYLPGHHTLSLYLRGGHGTYREDAPSERGGPGKLCLMPAGHEVNWVVGTGQTFVHLYFAPEQLAPLALRLLDREPRELRLPELNFADDPELVTRMARLAALDWADTGDRIAANELGHAVLADVLARHAGRAPRGGIRGGLAPALRRRLADWLEARLAEPVTVGEMAAFCALSEAHFAHAFRASFGVAPHEWIVARRIERAARLLRDRRSPTLDEIARATGHASASHLVRRFRSAWGMTPGQYRAAARA
ncbi:MAG: helix-turn-helix domain-containing protein [Burkholderiaceae bacterium]|jgi:AraC family transcriptional regulator